MRPSFSRYIYGAQPFRGYLGCKTYDFTTGALVVHASKLTYDAVDKIITSTWTIRVRLLKMGSEDIKLKGKLLRRGAEL
jgi:hypothetical protein